jgi:hypothetical protein
MVAGAIIGAAAAILLFAFRLLLWPRAGLRYDRTIMAALRIVGLAGLATVISFTVYALLVA